MFLNCHSYYSLRYGTLSIDQLLEEASRYKIRTLALTDLNNTMGIPEFIKKAKIRGIKPIAGCEFRNNGHLLYVLLALNREGLREINAFITHHNLNKKPYPIQVPFLAHVATIYPMGKIHPGGLKANQWIGIHPGQVNKLVASESEHYVNRMVALLPVCFSGKKQWFLHKVLRAIDLNLLFTKLSEEDYAKEDELFFPENRIENAFARYPVIAENTRRLMENCHIDMEFSTQKNKKVFTQTPEEDLELLKKLAFEGMKYRYGTAHPAAEERIRYELDIIHKLKFSAYFLIAWDIIRYAMSQGFYHVGRGSGANSIVAYCLRITDVDPISLNLYFERFLNPRRTSPPDFDIDFSWKDRDEIQHYIIRRYGKDHAALLGATSTFRDRSIYRELGKVFGLPPREIDLLIKDPENNLIQNDITLLISTLAGQIADFPNQRTLHAGGILISEEPLHYYTALDLPPKGFPTTQWDMYLAEELGFEKFDILSQRGIGHIKEAVEIVLQQRGLTIDIHRTEDFIRDEKVREHLRSGETMGCFYIESPGMRGLLKKLRCDNYPMLVAASSIIRPGVSKSGMMRTFIERFHNPSKISYLHPVMKEQLEETFGVMVYQEDVLKVAHHFAGLGLDEADILRRAMSGKFRSKVEFKRIEEKFFSNCQQKGYPETLSREVWRQIESFAGYSFSKAHSASYAVESFQSLFLKAHYPKEFMVAVLNNFGGFYSPWVYLNEAKRCGAKIELPCIRHSARENILEGDTIFLGFVYVQNLEKTTIDRVIEARRLGGLFCSLSDFLERVSIPKEQSVLLIRLGALRSLCPDKAKLLWELHLRAGKKSPLTGPRMLFSLPQREYTLPALETSPLENAYDEIELLGFPVSMDAFDILETNFRGELKARQMSASVGKKVRMLGRLATLKYVPTARGEIMQFGTFTDYEGEFFDTVHFPDSLQKYPFRGNGIYLILGKVVEESGFCSLEVEKMARMPYKRNPQE